MTRGPDGRARISELKLCEIVGVSQQYRQGLVRRKLLGPAPAGGCGLADVIELATLERLAHHVSPTEQVIAWNEIRPKLRDVVPSSRFDVVFNRELGSAEIVCNDAALRAAVTSGRPVQVIELGPRLEEVLKAFRRWAAVPTSRSRASRERRRGTRAS